MEDMFSHADEFGPLKIIHVQEASVGLKAVLVVDNVAAGPAIGGMRIAPDVTTEEGIRLARAMTKKNAAAGLPHGGGKIVIQGDPRMPKPHKAELLRCLASALRGDEDYVFAPDMGTDEECMAWIRDEVGRVVGLPRELGGIPLDEIGATGWGLSHVAEIAADFAGLELQGARVAVQGFGAVGKNVAHFLAERGAVLVAASDSRGTIQDPNGLEVAALIAHKAAGHSVADFASGSRGDCDAIVDVPCDIWIPAARPDVINEANVERLNTKLFLQGANIPATAGAEARLFEKGVLYVPDFIANAGGVICAAMEYHGASESAALASIEEKLRRNTTQVLERARRDNLPPRQAAEELALERVRKAMGFRRFPTFSMYRIRVHGRGGQGVKTASRILGTALFRAGYQVQDAPRYGAERRGAPIFAYVRAAQHGPINERGIITHPDLVVVTDDTLVAMPAAGVLQGLGPDTTLLINSHESADTWRQRLNTAARVLILPTREDEAEPVALRELSASCAAAAAALLGVVPRERVLEALEEELGHLGEAVVMRKSASALAAFDAMAPQAGSVREGGAIAATDYTAPAWVALPLDGAGGAAPAIHAGATSVEVRTGLWRTMRPVIDYDKCNKCWWVCSTYCPDACIAVAEDGTPDIDYDHCKGCLVCVAQCPPHAIAAVPEHLARQQDAAREDDA
jgi:glutamate dehydrogenase (NAD(P)+)